MKQHTISKTVSTSGIGLHSGKTVHLTFEPLPQNSGIQFCRTDLPDNPKIPAHASLVKDTMMSSNLIKDGVKIGTVEHLLSAVAGLGIDNLMIKVSAPEIPIMDGSALPFIKILLQAGLEPQTAAKKFLKILDPIKVNDGDKWAELVPFDGFELNFEIDFDHPAFDKNQQSAKLDLSKASRFIKEVSLARTFGFLKDIETLRKNNLALGGSMENAIVLDDKGIANPEGLRLQDEFVKHKILDAVGDLYLIGYPLIAQFNAYKSGHELNNKLVNKVLTSSKSFEIVTFDDNVMCPISYNFEKIALSI